MGADLFISYAWTSDEHRAWVRLLAAHLKAIGYNVLIDADVDYGDSLSGFMRRPGEASHVLLIVDENYVRRADHKPDSGVAIENGWISQAHPGKPSTWLSVLFKDNPGCQVPAWLKDHQPKGHDFNANAQANDFPGSEQVEELWRWVEGLPGNRDNAVSVATLRARASRVERVDVLRDPGHWRNPALAAEVHFEYSLAPSSTYRMGLGGLEFALQVTERQGNTIYVYADPIKAVGLVRPDVAAPDDLASHITPGRVVEAGPGDVVVLLNEHGALCRVEIVAAQGEVNAVPYSAPYVDFRYDVAQET